MRLIFILLSLLWATAFELSAQQLPLYSQLFHNPFLYNPAYAGLQPAGSASLSYRSQWAGLDGAPQTLQLGIDYPFYEYRTGAGVNVYQDRIKETVRTKVMGSYAYHIFGPYENSSIFSMGLMGGIVHNRIDMSQFYVLHPNDPRLLENTGTYTGFEMGFGLNYRIRNVVELSFVAPQLVTPGLGASDDLNNNINLTQHFMFAVRGIIVSNDGYNKYEPIVMIRRGGFAPFQYETGLQYTYGGLLRVSATYRHQYSVSLAAGVTLERFTFGIARDFVTSDLLGAVGGSNEIMLGYRFNHIPTERYDGQRGQGGLIRKKKYHPSRPGPLQNSNPRKGPKRKKPKGKYRRI